MDEAAKKTALRMIPYGIYVLTADDGSGNMAAATINWATQASFTPPLVVVALKGDSMAGRLVTAGRPFVLNVLGKGQTDVAFKFFKTVQREGQSIAGEKLVDAANGQPALASAAAHLECRATDTVVRGDHTVVVAEVTEARVLRQPDGRPDDAVLAMRDLGEKTFYGG